MIKLTWVEFFLRNVPEMLIMVWGICTISKEKLNIRDYILSSLYLAIITYVTRNLPIYFGLHTLINIFLSILVLVLKDMPLIKTIYSTLLVFMVLCFSELMNMIGLNLLNISTNIKGMNPVLKEVFGIPSLLFMILLILIMRNISKRRNFSLNN